MQIEETVSRELYRGFELIQLRYGDAKRWHITDNKSGMICSYGFVTSAIEAKARVDDLLKRKSGGRRASNPN